ncbi:hypothetical protein [Burkholderia contaminans]|uniref:hypothetical protein n=1 Tax=Burkholderia contaminans TaxID=488447 RepID=UPI00158DB66E|nr:hypothetical protein [Burkholderia contaminans]ELK6465606.1 hypothetical protein [Burkholderia contaminans]
MGNQRANVFGVAIALIFLLSVSRSHAADAPVVIVDAINARADEGHKLQSPIIDAGPAMKGVYIYFMINTSDVPGYSKGGRPYMLDAHLIFSDESQVLHDVLFDRYVKDDGVPEIFSVFFVNADRDQKNKEIVVLVRTPLNHYDYGGDYYDGYVYKLTGDPRTGVVFAGLQSDASAPFLDQCECDFRDGRSTRARYKNAESIRKVLEGKYPTSRVRGK